MTLTPIQVAIVRAMRAAPDASAIMSVNEIVRATAFAARDVERALTDMTGSLVQWARVAPNGPSGYMLTLRGWEERI